MINVICQILCDNSTIVVLRRCVILFLGSRMSIMSEELLTAVEGVDLNNELIILPNELLEAILKHIESTKDLKALCLVNK